VAIVLDEVPAQDVAEVPIEPVAARPAPGKAEQRFKRLRQPMVLEDGSRGRAPVMQFQRKRI
jgi:hypothetical protein